MSDVLLAIPITGAVTIVASVVTALVANRLTRDTTIQSERRQARMNERREAVSAVTRFLDIAAKADAQQSVTHSLRKTFDDNIDGIADGISREEFEQTALREIQEGPRLPEVAYAFSVAFTAAPTEEMVTALAIVFAWEGRQEAGSAKLLRLAIQGTRKIVQDYIVEGEADSV